MIQYKMEVLIVNPTDANKDRILELECGFGYDAKQYGNGHSVMIRSKGGSEWCYDLRYDKSFHKDEKETWLTHWAKTNWSGEKGSWKVKRLEINKVEGNK